MIQSLRRNRLGYIMLIPSTLLIAIVSIYPLFHGLQLSFYEYNLLRGEEKHFIGLENFRELFTSDPTFVRTLIFSVIYTISVVVVSYLLGLLLALLLNQKIKFRGLMRAVILIPWVIPPVVAATNWLWLLNDQLGLVNNVLRRLEIIDRPIMFLADRSLAKVTVIMTSAWKSFPFMMITLLAGLQSIPEDLYESAHLDGAGRMARLRHITLPLIKPITLIATTLMFIWTFNNFENIYLLTQGGPMESTYVLPIYSYYTAFLRSNFGYASAISTAMLVILTVLALVYMRVIKDSRDNW